MKVKQASNKLNFSSPAIVTLLFCLYLAFGTVLAINTGIQHDHIWYLSEWIEESKGQNPWQAVNPYGPIHVLLGIGIAIDPLFPKLIMLWIFMFSNLYFFVSQKGYKLIRQKKLYLLLLIPFNFMVINLGIIYGLNDTLVAAFLILALDAKLKNRSKVAGFLLGIATLLKFYPLLFILFMSINRRKIDVKFLFSSMLTILLGMLITFNFWGLKILYSLLFSLERSSSLLSPLEIVKQFYVQNPDFQFRIEALNSLLTLNKFLIQFNFLFCLLAVIFVIYMSFKYLLNWTEILLFGILTFLSVYKVGHPQFFLSWIVLLLPFIFHKTVIADKLLKRCIPIIVFLQIYQIGFFLSGSYSRRWEFMYYNAGILFAPIAIYTIFSLIKIFQERHGTVFTLD